MGNKKKNKGKKKERPKEGNLIVNDFINTKTKKIFNLIGYCFRLAELIAIFLTIWVLFLNLSDRKEDTIVKAWNTVYSSTGKGGSGIIKSLEFLNRESESFSGMDLGGYTLTGINLRGADLSGARFRQTNLTNADFRDAKLTPIGLSTQTDLSFTILDGADFCGADLRYVYFEFVNSMKSIKIKGANVYKSSFDQTWAREQGAVSIEADDKWPKLDYDGPSS